MFKVIVNDIDLFFNDWDDSGKPKWSHEAFVFTDQSALLGTIWILNRYNEKFRVASIVVDDNQSVSQ